MDPDVVAAAFTAAAGLAFVAVALWTLRSGSRLRRLYRIGVDDDGSARSNAAVVGLAGAGLCALAAAGVAGVPERVIGAAGALASGGLCLVLGWFVRYGDRRDLLTTPHADRETARRLGGMAFLTGLAVPPLVPAIWFDAGSAVAGGLLLGALLVTLVATVYAFW